MKLPEEFLDHLRARTPLQELIGRRVTLTLIGKLGQMKGCCPFHSEKSQSFYLFDSRYHCFGCGAHGDAIAFVMQSENLPFGAAVEKLAAEAGLSMPKGEPASGVRCVAVKKMTTPDPVRERPLIENKSGFTETQVEAILGTAARLLVRQEQVVAASILANGGGRIVHWDHDNWNGGFDIWRFMLGIPPEVYFDLKNREEIEGQINSALKIAAEPFNDILEVQITTELEEDPGWREKVNQHLVGKGITNQGRVRSDSIATRQYDGLLFRSRPEVLFYNALKTGGVPFAPLSVVLNAGIPRRRVEPDFFLYKEGLSMIVEIDGDLFHSETPAAAHARLKFLTDEGVILERINASECDTPDKAREAVERVLRTFEKRRKAR